MAEINKCFKAEIVDEIPFITLCDTNQLYIDYKKHRYILVWSGCHLVFYSIVSRNVVVRKHLDDNRISLHSVARVCASSDNRFAIYNSVIATLKSQL